MARIGEIIKEYEVVPLEAPVEAPQHTDPSRTGEEAPTRELQPADSSNGQLSSVPRESVSAGLAGSEA